MNNDVPLTQSEQRVDMIKRICVVIIFDFLLLVTMSFVILTRIDKTKECSSELFGAGMAIYIYNVFFVARNVCICAVSYFTKNPHMNSTVARLCFIFLDCLAYTTVVIWATVKLVDEMSVYCRD